MITLHGTYADECNGQLLDKKLEYVCRVFSFGDRRNIKWYDAVGNIVDINDGDVLLQCGNGTWFALFRCK